MEQDLFPTGGAAIALEIDAVLMEASVDRCCGLDVHRSTVVARGVIGQPGHKPRKERRTFGTLTKDRAGRRATG